MDFASVTSWFSEVPTDWIVVACLVGLASIDVFRIGTGRVAAIALAALISESIFAVAKNTIVLGTILSALTFSHSDAISFVAMTVILFFLVRRLTVDYTLDGLNPVSSIAAGISGVSILVAIWIHTPALQSLWHFGPLVQSLFAETYMAWWILVPLTILALTTS